MRFGGFDWDSHNWPKCGRHGVPKADIEAAVRASIVSIRDPHVGEQRLRIIGFVGGRHVFVVLTPRLVGDARLARPISARYMHRKEVRAYVQGT